MGKRHIIEILASKRLTKSFRQVDTYETWHSISLTKEEAKAIISHAIDKMDETSEPLTITISIGDNNESST